MILDNLAGEDFSFQSIPLSLPTNVFASVKTVKENKIRRACIKICSKGWLAIAKLKPLSLFISVLSMLKKAFYNVKIEK